jgi:hypothetical protein
MTGEQGKHKAPRPLTALDKMALGLWALSFLPLLLALLPSLISIFGHWLPPVVRAWLVIPALIYDLCIYYVMITTRRRGLGSVSIVSLPGLSWVYYALFCFLYLNTFQLLALFAFTLFHLGWIIIAFSGLGRPKAEGKNYAR